MSRAAAGKASPRRLTRRSIVCAAAKATRRASSDRKEHWKIPGVQNINPRAAQSLHPTAPGLRRVPALIRPDCGLTLRGESHSGRGFPMRLPAVVLLLTGSMLVVADRPAWAQNAPGLPPAEGLEQRDASSPPTGPVGHRQPQSKDLPPQEMPAADQAMQDLDKALAKKLTICRGC